MTPSRRLTLGEIAELRLLGAHLRPVPTHETKLLLLARARVLRGSGVELAEIAFFVEVDEELLRDWMRDSAGKPLPVFEPRRPDHSISARSRPASSPLGGTCRSLGRRRASPSARRCLRCL